MLNTKQILKFKTLTHIQQFHFARNYRQFVPLYPQDDVMVLPPWDEKNMSRYKMRILSKSKNFEEMNKITIGTILEIKRKQGYATVSNTPRRLKYRSVESFFKKYDAEGVEAINPVMEFVPIALNRIRLLDKTSEGEKPKMIKVEMKRDADGQMIRVKKGTDIEVPWIRKKGVSYEERIADKTDGPKDTNGTFVQLKTFNGINFESIAKEFVERIREKEKIEANLVLKDK